MKPWITTDWLHPRALVALRANEIQVWRIKAHGAGPLAEACACLLDDEEQSRHGRMRKGTARDEFLVGRGCLRVLLGEALQCDPREVRFQTGTYGKLSVAGVSFSLAHSHGEVLIALSLERTVGVDVERVDPKIETLDIARASFAREEIAGIENAREGTERVDAFYRCWTRKEAVVKAHGQGLTFALDSFAVSVRPGEMTEVRLGSGGEEGRFFAGELEVGEGFMAALAVDTADVAVSKFVFDPSLMPAVEAACASSSGNRGFPPFAERAPVTGWYVT